MTQALAGKVALVTGASMGIGLASAMALRADGASVVIMGRGQATLDAARAELAAAPGAGRVEAFVGDAADEATVKRALAFAHGLAGRLDILVSVVGNPTFKPLLMREYDDVRAEIDLNFGTAFLLTRHGAPLLPRDGAIVCVSSAAATQATFGLSIYGAAKAALERFVRAAAFELGGAGIRINAVRPGATLSPERVAEQGAGGMADTYSAITPLARLGVPEDIARVVRFLSGPESGWVTGQTIAVDGGLDQVAGPDFMDAFHGKDTMDRIRAGKPPEG